MEHLAKNGCFVARCLPAANGQFAVAVPLPEGTRALMLFEFLDVEFTSDAAEDIRAFGHGLAALHISGDNYQGPASAYVLDLEYLLLRPLEGLLRAPTMSAELRPHFEVLGQKLQQDILNLGKLSRVLCHGPARNFRAKTARALPSRRAEVAICAIFAKEQPASFERHRPNLLEGSPTGCVE